MIVPKHKIGYSQVVVSAHTDSTQWCSVPSLFAVFELSGPYQHNTSDTLAQMLKDESLFLAKFVTPQKLRSLLTLNLGTLTKF